MELLTYTAISFFLGGFLGKRESTKKTNKEIEKLKQKQLRELHHKENEVIDLQTWKNERETREGKNRDLTAEIQRQEKQITQNKKLNQEAISNLKTNGDYKTATKKVEDLSNRLRKSIVKIENDFAKKIASYANVGDEPKGEQAIIKQKQELARDNILPNPYMKNPYQTNNDEEEK